MQATITGIQVWYLEGQVDNIPGNELQRVFARAMQPQTTNIMFQCISPELVVSEFTITKVGDHWEAKYMSD